MDLVCPRCRHRVEKPVPGERGTSIVPQPPSAEATPSGRAVPMPSQRSKLSRCPHDGMALVSAEVLAEADGDPFLGTTIAERFVIVGKLGAGSMGTVYRARQEAMGREVAIKILRSDRAFDAQAKARFTREARAMSLLTSPHTVTVFDFGEIVDASADPDFGPGAGSVSSASDDGTAWSAASLYLAMELLEGESLGQRLKRVRRLGVAEAARFARHALLSLAEAHDKGIIHRDLKPDNLFIAKAPTGEHEEVCKVLDFGIAKVVTDSEKSVDALETQAGTVFGTPRYMSPEQAQGRPLDARSDLYSLGVLLYQMLVGRPPFTDDDAVVVMARHIKSVPVPPIEAAPDADIPRSLSDLLLRVLGKRPEDRPRTAQDFIAEIERAMDDVRPSLSRERGAAAAGEVGATSELLAVVPSTLRPAPRRSAALVALGTVAVTLIGAALTLSKLRPAGGDVHTAEARLAREATLRVSLALRDVAVMRGVAAARSSPASPVVTSSAAGVTAPEPRGAAPAALAPLKRKPAQLRKPYVKFD
jgi:eukaryotic-like serine/threonine-protein kinase